MGQQSASTANRDGGAERGAAPAVQQRVAGALALLGHSEHLRRARELALLHTAPQHEPHTLSRLRPGPRIGALLRLVLLDALPDLQRCPRGQALVSDGRLGQWAKDAAGQRYGPAGTQIGTASLTWAVAAAAGWFRRNTPQGPQHLARLEKKHGPGTALPGLAPKLAPAVSPR
jgi:hypothetical protein